jgi:hypothetical protein
MNGMFGVDGITYAPISALTASDRRFIHVIDGVLYAYVKMHFICPSSYACFLEVNGSFVRR